MFLKLRQHDKNVGSNEPCVYNCMSPVVDIGQGLNLERYIFI